MVHNEIINIYMTRNDIFPNLKNDVKPFHYLNIDSAHVH